MSFKKHYRREFLNKKECTALIETTVELSGSSGGLYIDGSVRITDCHRLMRLEFDSGSRKEHRNSIAKLDGLIRELQEFRGALVTAGEVHET